MLVGGMDGEVDFENRGISLLQSVSYKKRIADSVFPVSGWIEQMFNRLAQTDFATFTAPITPKL